ncbi:hypothetical protein ACFQS6_19890 [Xanthomonas populi]
MFEVPYTNKTLAACGLALFAAISAQARTTQHHIKIATNPGLGYHAHAELKRADGSLIYSWDKWRKGDQGIYWTYNYGNDNSSIEVVVTAGGESHKFSRKSADGNICIEFYQGDVYGVQC